MQIWWLTICICREGEKVKAYILQKFRSYRREIVWIELGLALTERSGFIIVACYFLFAQLFKEAKWSGQC